MSEIEVQSKPEAIVFHPLPKNKRFHVLTGCVFGSLTVLGFAGFKATKNRPGQWHVKCTCGRITVACGYLISSGTISSCGCKEVKRTLPAHFIHGMSGTPEFTSWASLKGRCCNPNNPSFKRYGGRGITVCERWLESFDNFYKDMGPRPSLKHSLDRIDVNGNYEPSNCRWATQKEQCRNTSANTIVTYNGKSQCAAAWEEELGFGRGRISHRLACGWGVEKAFNTPIRTTVRKPKPPAQTASTVQHA